MMTLEVLRSIDSKRDRQGQKQKSNLKTVKLQRPFGHCACNLYGQDMSPLGRLVPVLIAFHIF